MAYNFLSGDPDSRFLHTRDGTVQGYNAPAVVTEHPERDDASVVRRPGSS